MLESCLRIGPDEVRLKRMTASKEPVCHRVRVAETWLVPSKSEAIVLGVLEGDGSSEERWGEISPSEKPCLSSDVLTARTVVDIGKPIIAVRVLNMSDDDQVIREGTDIASCEVIDSVIVVEKTELGTHKIGDELSALVKELYDRSSGGLNNLQKNLLYSLLGENIRPIKQQP